MIKIVYHIYFCLKRAWTKFFEKSLIVSPLWAPTSIKTILSFVGRFVDSKGTTFLKKVANNFDGLILIVSAGAREYFEDISNVKLYEYISQEKLNAVYSASDMLMLPSTRSEGMPLVLLESLASGTPVLVADAVGNRDIVNSNIGEIFEPDNLEDFLNKVGPAKNKSSLACREFVNKYTWDICVDRQIEIYNENRF